MEVDSKPEATHEELLPQLCGAASAIANTLNELHSSALLAAEDSIHAIRTKVGLQFLQLKQINRELNIGTEDVRRHTALKRAHIDETHLQLQNLAYEKANLVKEIGVARDFRPSTQPIQLIDAAVYDQSIAADQREAVIGSHRYHMARLQHELSERQRLVARVEELTHKKRILAARNTAKRQQFSGMMTHIDNVIKAAAPLFSLFQVPSDRVQPDPRANLLPPALYTLFCSAFAHQAAFAGEIDLSIEGSDADAQQLLQSQDSMSESIDSNDAPANNQPIPWWPRAAESEPAASNVPDNVWEAHPLQISITINTTDTKTPVLKLRFVYLRHLDVVTVFPTSADAAMVPWLADLFPASFDQGTSLPLGKHQLQFINSCGQFNSKSHGLAYRWLQQLCGVHHLDGNPVVESTGVTSQHLISFADCVKAIRARVMTRAVLLAQAAKLAALEFPFDVTRTRYSTPSTQLLSFAPIGENCFRAVLQLSDIYQIEATITVHAGYPTAAPSFALKYLKAPSAPAVVAPARADAESYAFVQTLKADSAQAGAQDLALQGLEREMNQCASTVFVELFGSVEAAAAASTIALSGQSTSCLLLAALVRKLQVCIDILAECERCLSSGSSTAVVTSNAGRMFDRPVRGRDRRRPFWFDGVKFEQR